MRKREKPRHVAKAKASSESHVGKLVVSPFVIGQQEVAPGSVETVELPISRLSTRTQMVLPVRVLHGSKPGPVLFVSAGVHGDEIIGVEIIRRLLRKISIKRLSGTLLCIPVVNVFGFIMHQRYLPDRRDLNRSFPGSASGSLAGQLANVFSKEILRRSDYGIDLHSAAVHRTNLPQIRVNADSPRANELAFVFGAPAIIVSPLRDGSLRQKAAEQDVDVLLYEAGEALRFDELSIRLGVSGILRVMSHLGMVSHSKVKRTTTVPVQSNRTQWVRAPEGGIFRAKYTTGHRVKAETVLGYLSDPFGDTDVPVLSPLDGIIIGRTNVPIVNQGDALMHVAQVKTVHTAIQRIDQISEDALTDPLFDEDEVI